MALRREYRDEETLRARFRQELCEGLLGTAVRVVGQETSSTKAMLEIFAQCTQFFANALRIHDSALEDDRESDGCTTTMLQRLCKMSDMLVSCRYIRKHEDEIT